MNEEMLEKLQKIISQQGAPYTHTTFGKLQSIDTVLKNFREGEKITLAGRLYTKREHGKSCFGHIGDVTGKIQIYVRLDILGEQFSFFKQLDVGDIIGIKGELFKTRTGEPTVLVKELTLLSKSLHPLPEKWHGLKDVEIRYRRRYLDLIANPSVGEIFRKRSGIIASIRKFMVKQGYLEVDTPMLHPIPGGASGKPFITHHNATRADVFLRIAPELYLKRLLVGGFDRIFEINKCFRNEGVSVRHSPEFTMLEAYCAYKDCSYMMDLCEELLTQLVAELYEGNLSVEYQGTHVDFTPPWPRISFAHLFKQEFGVNPQDSQEEVLTKLCKKLKVSLEKISRTQILNLTEELVEKYYPSDTPCFVTDFFTWTAPLAKARKDNPFLLERFELFIAGMEVANSYSELNDPLEQRKRLSAQIAIEEELPRKLDEDFLLSLEYAMPPAAGLGIGIDRIIMILLNQPSIRDVIFFPLLRPVENGN